MAIYTLTAAQLRGAGILNSFIIPSSSTPSFDPDAQAFITAAAITNPTQQSAINTLVVSLKGYNLWTKMKAIYPFVGGTATTHKWNLKDPRDLDAAFRIAFFGGWTHSANGIEGNSFNYYSNTYIDPSIQFSSNQFSSHFSVYSRTILPTSIDILVYSDIGPIDNLNQGKYYFLGSYIADEGIGPVIQQFYSLNTDINAGGVYDLTSNNLNTQGLFTTSRLNNSSFALYRNSTQLQTQNSMTSPFSSEIIGIGGDNIDTGYTRKQYAFATIGTGLTNTDTSNLYTAIQAFQTTLGRQV